MGLMIWVADKLYTAFRYCMRYKIVCAVLMLIGLWILVASPLVKINYTEYQHADPLKSPVKIMKVVGNELQLEDGRTVVFQNDFELYTLDQLMKANNNQFEFVTNPDTTVSVYGITPGGIMARCGSACKRKHNSQTLPVIIPIFKTTVYRKKRMIIGSARE